MLQFDRVLTEWSDGRNSHRDLPIHEYEITFSPYGQ